ncbi:MAG: hypothetical protein OMM_07541 [Candidatus Magnetoglobus multicellularis str. Araruama]|uniref:DUF2914 domain-containing protein n=1 Tax=Candidatus Magnetoglobus multicellularis str. Araruama TaxID=890399 RepID=A0A1V1PBV7_9BACT|nr:MAG: hypothetical protein OMM_07541 [Candidatus Magnetoglobus multicellularis str. Araruama]
MWTLVVLVACFIGQSFAIDVNQIHICKDVIDLAPIEVDSSFDAYVGKLYCFTKIVDVAAPPTQIYHVWFYENAEIARVPLDIGGVQWRTYSSKVIPPTMVGNWQVLVLGPDENIIESVEFIVGN